MGMACFSPTRCGADRIALVEERIQGIDVTLDAELPGRVTARHLLDAAADMTTARRIAARAVERLPEDPEWDEAGVRMELLR